MSHGDRAPCRSGALPDAAHSCSGSAAQSAAQPTTSASSTTCATRQRPIEAVEAQAQGAPRVVLVDVLTCRLSVCSAGSCASAASASSRRPEQRAMSRLRSSGIEARWHRPAVVAAAAAGWCTCPQSAWHACQPAPAPRCPAGCPPPPSEDLRLATCAHISSCTPLTAAVDAGAAAQRQVCEAPQPAQSAQRVVVQCRLQAQRAWRGLTHSQLAVAQVHAAQGRKAQRERQRGAWRSARRGARLGERGQRLRAQRVHQASRATLPGPADQPQHAQVGGRQVIQHLRLEGWGQGGSVRAALAGRYRSGCGRMNRACCMATRGAHTSRQAAGRYPTQPQCSTAPAQRSAARAKSRSAPS